MTLLETGRLSPSEAADFEIILLPVECAIIVPTLNERDNVAVLLRAIERALPTHNYEVLFVDDWSSDGTAEAITEVARRNPRIRLLRRHGRRGLSTAVVEGMLATTAPIVVVIDADMQHDESLIPRMIDAVANGTADVAIGSRYCPDGSVGEWAQGRAWGSRVATGLSRRLLKSDVADPMSGFFAIRRDLVIDALPGLSNFGFKILADLLASSTVPLKIVEFPYRFRPRAAGESKLDSGVAIDFAMLLLDKRLGWLVSPQLLMFGAVGSLGLLIHLTVLRAMLGLPAVSFAAAQGTAVVCAIAFNFLLNNFITYRDQRLQGAARWWGLVSFYAVCGLGAIANIGVGQFVFNHDHHQWLLAGLSGALVGSIWNYVASSRVTWRRR